MGMPGAPDFQGQSAQSLIFCEAVAIDTVGTQTIDITAFVQPNWQGLVLFWCGSGLGLTRSLLVDVQAFPAGFLFAWATLIPDTGSLVTPFYGAIFTNDATQAAQIQASPGDALGEIVGTLFVFGQTAPVTSTPTVKRQYIGIGGRSNAINVIAGATTTILAAPPGGSYYRLKATSVTILAAPAAVAIIRWQTGVVFGDFLRHEATVAAGQTFNVTLDYQCDNPVQVINNTSTTITCCVAFETWPV